MAQDTTWSVQLFGGLRVSGPDTEIDRFPTRRAALLLARVALSRSGAIGRDDLATVLWPDDYLDATRLRLRQELNRLRDTLGGAAEILSADRSWVRLDLSRAVVDAKEFDRYLSAGDPAQRAKALALYTGPLMPEQSEDWVQAERQEYHAKHLSALIEHTDALLSEDRTEDALACALRAVRSDPYYEPARMAAIRSFVGVGDLGGAVRQYVEYEKAIVREFSARPSEAMQRLIASIRDKKATATVEPPPRKETEASFSTSSHLPVYLDRLVGREQEKVLLRGWLSSEPRQRLVTVTGPGGVGKTRLAVAVAGDAAQQFDGQVVFVGLADMEPAQKVLDRIHGALGTGLPSSKEPLPGWGAKRCLLVLDNLEHVLEEGRRVVREILHSHSGVCVLATSRQKLGLGGEQELPLAPLALPELSKGAQDLESSPAAELFLERSRAVRPDYSVSPDDLESLIMLLARLDGLPLAIELAAARIGFLSTEQMLGEIDDRFTFLVSRRADAGPRQRSLRAAIEWSFQDLNKDLKEALEAFSVFRGGWSMEAGRLATGRSDILEVIQDLLDRSLIYQEQTPLGARFGMLEAIRDYVLTELTQAKASRKIHAEVIADIVFPVSRDLVGANANRNYEIIRMEMDNIRVAIDWAADNDKQLALKLGASIWRFMCARWVTGEGAILLDRILGEPLPEDSPELAECLLGRGRIAVSLGDMSGACHWCERAIEVGKRLESAKMVSWARMNLAHAQLEEGRVKEAHRTSLEAMEGVTDFNRPFVKNMLARTLARMGRPEEAMEEAEEVFAATVGKTNSEQSGRAFYTLAYAYADCGRLDGVYGLVQEALERLRPLGLQQLILACQLIGSREELRLGLWDAFDRSIAEAKTLASDQSDVTAEVRIACLEARKLARLGQYVEAVRTYESAIQKADVKGSALVYLLAARMLAHDLAESGRQEVAGEVLAAEAGLRGHLEFGLTLPETEELARTVALIGEPTPNSNVRSVVDLAAKVVAATAQIR